MPTCTIIHLTDQGEQRCRREPVFVYAGTHYCVPDLRNAIKLDAAYMKENGLPAPPKIEDVVGGPLDRNDRVLALGDTVSFVKRSLGIRGKPRTMRGEIVGFGEGFGRKPYVSVRTPDGSTYTYGASKVRKITGGKA